MGTSSKSPISGFDIDTDERLRIVLNALPIAVSWARLDDMNIIFMNRKFTQSYGYVVGDFATVQEWVEKAYPLKEHRERAVATWYKFFDNPTTSEFEIEPVEVDILCKNGEIKTAILGGVILPKDGLALATFVDISKRKRDELLIRTLAEQDPLTGLSNRRSFDSFLERTVVETILEKQNMHLLLLDIDYFKDINDSFGHQAGDQLLKEMAKRFKTCVRSSDIIARFGGDEFGIILTNSHSDIIATRICKKIIETINEPFIISGKEMYVGISIGIGRCPVDATDAHILFKIADQALYKSKASGRGSWSYKEEV